MHDVKIYVLSWKGDSQAQFGEVGSSLMSRHLVINGEDVFTSGQVKIGMDGSSGFVWLELYEPSDEYRELAAQGDFDPGSLKEVRARFTENEYLWGTDENVLLLPLRSVEFREADLVPVMV